MITAMTIAISRSEKPAWRARVRRAEQGFGTVDAGVASAAMEKKFIFIILRCCKNPQSKETTRLGRNTLRPSFIEE